MERVNHTALLGNMLVYFRERHRHCVDLQASILARDSRCEFTIGTVETSFSDNFLVRMAESTGGDDGPRDRLPWPNQSSPLDVPRSRVNRDKKEQTFQPRCQGPAFCLWSVGPVADYCR